jgi:hypothetical protein
VRRRLHESRDSAPEAYAINERGWAWITANIHTPNLSAKSAKTKSSSFDKEQEDEIPF